MPRTFSRRRVAVGVLAAVLGCALTQAATAPARADIFLPDGWNLLTPDTVSVGQDHLPDDSQPLKIIYTGLAPSGWWSAVGADVDAGASPSKLDFLLGGRGDDDDVITRVRPGSPQFVAIDRNGGCQLAGPTTREQTIAQLVPRTPDETALDIPQTFRIDLSTQHVFDLGPTDADVAYTTVNPDDNPIMMFDVNLQAGTHYRLRLDATSPGGVYLLQSEPTCKARTAANAAVALTATGEQVFTVPVSGWQGLVVTGRQQIQLTPTTSTIVSGPRVPPRALG